jgi:hypothetical protein
MGSGSWTLTAFRHARRSSTKDFVNSGQTDDKSILSPQDPGRAPCGRPQNIPRASIGLCGWKAGIRNVILTRLRINLHIERYVCPTISRDQVVPTI